MRDCTTCNWDREVVNCEQGHDRDLVAKKVGYGTEIVPIKDCHAWKEKGKCLCKSPIFSSGMKDLFDIICKQCGEKIS